VPGFDVLIPHSDNWLHIKKIETETELNTKSQRLTRALNKAIKNNLTSEIRTDKEAVSVFYGLHVATRKKLGVPVQSKRYFENLFQNIICKNLGFVLLVKKDDRYISAGVFCKFKETLTFKYGASDPKALQFNPNHMMLWEAMVYGHNQGFIYFDFGKTSFSTPGLEVFKMEFKPIEYNLAYSYFPTRPKPGLFGKIEKYVVAPVLKNSPAFVCRFSGELLYKYFAV
jgi:lipid II:glycine glycyltransferase (peptidoglycan interpeptide bridge formation enzyme)